MTDKFSMAPDGASSCGVRLGVAERRFFVAGRKRIAGH